MYFLHKENRGCISPVSVSGAGVIGLALHDFALDGIGMVGGDVLEVGTHLHDAHASQFRNRRLNVGRGHRLFGQVHDAPVRNHLLLCFALLTLRGGFGVVLLRLRFLLRLAVVLSAGGNRGIEVERRSGFGGFGVLDGDLDGGENGVAVLVLHTSVNGVTILLRNANRNQTRHGGGQHGVNGGIGGNTNLVLHRVSLSAF